ncbi:FkbM family methyltransferase [Alphaproteobacteria bacterium]|nr:FkbM family methyltransferase [Alphaproteobacteria bacterium]
MKRKVVFYFPWEEVSGGPIYLSNLANELCKDSQFEVYYTDYQPGLTDTFLSKKVKKIIVNHQDFGIKIQEPITLVTPIYFANWLPAMHPKSRVVFVNWHVCSIDTLRTNWPISSRDMATFLSLVDDTKSVFFLDESHRLGQNIRGLDFEKNIVPIPFPRLSRKTASGKLVANNEINAGVLGRLCEDKIYSVLNLLKNFSCLKTSKKINVHIVGDGPFKDKIKPEHYKNINIVFWGTLQSRDLDHFLRDKIDVLFGMGTSILEGANVKLPSVIIPHKMKPFDCDKYVYLQNSTGACLGWTDNQFSELSLVPKRLSQIISDIYEMSSKEKLGQAAHKYLLKNHGSNAANVKFKKALKASKLTYQNINNHKLNFKQHLKMISVFGYDLISFRYGDNAKIEINLFDKLPAGYFRKRNELGHFNFYIFGIPLLIFRRNASLIKIVPFYPKFRRFYPKFLSVILSNQESLNLILNRVASDTSSLQKEVSELSNLSRAGQESSSNSVKRIERKISSLVEEQANFSKKIKLQDTRHSKKFRALKESLEQLYSLVSKLGPETRAEILDSVMPRFNRLIDQHSNLAANILEQNEASSNETEGVSSELKNITASTNALERESGVVLDAIRELQYIGKNFASSKLLKMNPDSKILSDESFAKFNGDISSEYLALLSNLDEASQKVVGRILNRLQRYINDGETYFMFTEREQSELSKIYDQHNSKIVKLNDDCFAYGDYLLPINLITTSVLFYKHFMEDNLDLALLKNKNIIDAGASFGDSALILSKYTRKKVIAFEPSSAMHKLALKTVSLNNLKNVRLINKGLGNKSGTKQFIIEGDYSRVLPDVHDAPDSPDQIEEVDFTSLDQFVTQDGLKDIGLIKVDVEGAERDLLLGAKKTIEKHKPILLISIYHSAEDFFGIKPMIESWNLGYKFSIRKPSDASIIVDTILIAQVDTGSSS